MTRDPFLDCRDTDIHTLPGRTFYKAKIPVLHNQLRNLISSPQQNIVYYVNQHQVFLVDTTKRKRAYIATLPFDPRCTATGHGYFCAGGDKEGHFAWLKLPQSPSARNGVPDGPLSAYASGVDRSASHAAFDYMEANNWDLVRRPRLEHLGDEIVNSISIHRVKGDGIETADEVIAITTNNDQTVRWFSLTQGRQLKHERLDYALNHASMSSDGNLLIVVGDKEYAHFFERIESPSSSKNKSPSNSSPRYPSQEWVPLRKIRLHKPRGEKVSCYFTTAWSDSAKLCATASEHGYITVFDTQLIRDPECDPIVALVPSSRPLTNPGAVRSMCFAPDPWDLILWTENQGRVCIGDLRTGLQTRQVIQLDPDEGKVELVGLPEPPRWTENPDLYDFNVEGDLRRHRALNGGDGSAELSFATDYLAAAAERRRIERQGGYSEVDPDQPLGLTEQEQQILDGLRTTRQREDVLRHSPSQDGSSQEHRGSSRSVQYYQQQQQALIDSQNRRRLMMARQEHDSTLLNTARAFMRDSTLNGGGSSNDERDYLPRRRSSVLLSSSAADVTPPAMSPGPSSTSDPWRTIEAAMQRAATSSSLNPTSTSYTNISNGNDGPSASNTYASTPDEEDLLSNTPHIAALLRRQQLLQTSPLSALPSTRSGLGSTSRSTAITLPHLRERANDAALEARREALVQRAEAMSARNGESMAARARERELRRDAAVLGAWEIAHLRQRTGGGSRAVGGAAVSHDEEAGLGTTGAAFDDGGRVVYVGTVEGIFELKLDLQLRKFWPATEFR